MMRLLPKILGRLGAGVNASDRVVFRNMATPVEFARLLDRERSRSDRNGAAFSLLIYVVRDKDQAVASLACLARILQRRLRLTDDVGWIDRRRIGVLLPETAAAGAWTVADDVACRFPQGIPLPDCRVYSYPSQRRPGERAHGNGSSRHAAVERPVHAMEGLFMIRLPVWKRALDVAGASSGLILLSPLLVLVALAVRASSRGPVFFKQARAGLGGRRFLMYKFRTMYEGAEAAQQELLALNERDGPAFKIHCDPRVTRVGRFLRSTGLDELPQLWNVLRGEMSLVGPRPLEMRYLPRYSAAQRRRHLVQPGITGWAQVNGRNALDWERRFAFDLWYVDHRGIVLDLKILFLTAWKVLRADGISQAGHATMPDFLGTPTTLTDHD